MSSSACMSSSTVDAWFWHVLRISLSFSTTFHLASPSLSCSDALTCILVQKMLGIFLLLFFLIFFFLRCHLGGSRQWCPEDCSTASYTASVKHRMRMETWQAVGICVWGRGRMPEAPLFTLLCSPGGDRGEVSGHVQTRLGKSQALAQCCLLLSNCLSACQWCKISRQKEAWHGWALPPSAFVVI